MALRKLKVVTAMLLPLAAGCWARVAAAPLDEHRNPPPALIRSARSGLWSQTSTWQGHRVPGAGARVEIRTGDRVVYDVNSDQAIRLVHVAGTLAFAPDRDTQLDVGLIKIQPGEDASENGFDCDAHMMSSSQPRPALEVGTPWQPIDASHTARIRLVYFEGMDKDSCPAIVCCGGRMEFHGAPMSRTWVKLGATANAGDAVITLAEPVTGWRVGDHLIVTATERQRRERGTFRPVSPSAAARGGAAVRADATLPDPQPLVLFKAAERSEGVGEPRRERAGGEEDPSRFRNVPGAFNPEGLVGQPMQPYTEERTIRAMDGPRITLDRPLVSHHMGTGEFRGEVADLSRNVTVESADPAGVRGHTMYHRGSAGSISYAEFRHLGKEGVLGRYSLHFHLVGDTMRGSSVIGASIWDSANRWLTVHGTNYLVVRDCVGYQSVGHGFYVEDGTEAYNVFDRNLAVQAYAGQPLPKQNLPFDHNDGAGFWWANSLNTFTRNVACECDRYGFRFEATPTEGLDLHLPVRQPDGSARPVDIRTLPFIRFEDNEAHSEIYGFNLGEGVDGVGPDARHPFVVRNTRVWNTQWAFRPDSPSVLVDGLSIYASLYGVYRPVYDHQAYGRLTISQTTNPEAFNSGERPAGLTFPKATEQAIQRGREGAAVPLGLGEKRLEGAELTPAERDKLQKLLDSLAAGKPPERAEITPAEAEKLKRLFALRSAPERGRPVSRVDDPLDGQLVGPSCGPMTSAAFPQPLDPVDDLPPVTVITFVGKPVHGRLMVRGTTSDNGVVKQVRVNGREATALAPNFAEWEVTLDHARPGALKLTAQAEDAAGNLEKTPHVMTVNLRD